MHNWIQMKLAQFIFVHFNVRVSKLFIQLHIAVV